MRSASASVGDGWERCCLSHPAKFGTGDKVTKVESRGISREISATTCLIRKLPKLTPARPR